jgi:hypothetical protein
MRPVAETPMSHTGNLHMTQTPFPAPPGLDPNYVFGELVPLIAVVTVILVVAISLRWIFRSPVGEALAQRIRQGRRPNEGARSDPGHERAELEERVSALQEQVGELAERLEFTERLLAGKRERPMLRGE